MRVVGRYQLSKRYRLIVCGVVGLLALWPLVALAAEFRSGERVVISAPVTGDLYVYGVEASIEADVNGDVMAAAAVVHVLGDVEGSVYALGANEVVVVGNVSGSVMVAAIQVRVYGAIGGALRVAAQRLTLGGARVGRDLAATVSDLEIDADSHVAGDVLLDGGTAELAGSTAGALRGNADDVRLSGPVDGSVSLRVGTLRLLEGAAIGGDLRYTSDHELLADAGVALPADIQRITPEHPSFAEQIGRALVYAALRYGFALPFGAFLIALAPTFAQRSSETLRRRPLASLGWGALTAVAVPLALAVLTLTVVGLPIAVMLGVAFLVALYASQLIVALVIGALIAPLRWQQRGTRARLTRQLALGLLPVVLVRSIPFGDWTIVSSAAVAVVALGALSMAFVGARRGDIALPA